MKALWSLLLYIAVFQAYAADYTLYEENGKVGLKDKAGAVVIPAAFEALGWSDGSFSVIGQVTGYKINQKWGLINLKQQRITNAEYENMVPSGGDRVIVKKKVDPVSAHYGCIDLKGKVTVPFRYDGIKINGLQAIVFEKSGIRFKYGVIDLTNNVLVALEYKNIYPIGSLRYAVQNFDNKTALFSEAGNQLTPFHIDSISSFKSNRAIVYQGFHQGVINRDGIIEITPQFHEIKLEDNGSVKGKKINEWKLLDANNKTDHAIQIDELIPDKGLYQSRINGRVGLLNEKLEILIPVSYSFLGEFRNGKAVAGLNGKYGLIRTDNSQLLPIQFDSLVLGERLVRVSENLLGKPSWSLYDTFGIKKTDRSYEKIVAYNGKFYKVKNYGLTGVVDRFGKETIHCVYDSILHFNNEQLVVQFHGHYGIIDYNENWLLPPQPFPVQLVDDTHFLLRSGKLTELKNFNGDLIYFTDNRIILKDGILKEYLPDGTEKEINLQGITISRTTPAVLEDTQIISSESEGLRGIKRNGRYGFIDDKGRLRIANRYEGIGQFRNGLAPVKILNKWGFVDKADKIAVNPSYEYVSEFYEHVAIAKKQKFGFINRQGQTLLDFRYDSIYSDNNGNFILVNDGLKGLANPEGRVMIETRFDLVEDLGNGFVIVMRDKKYGLTTSAGLSTIPMIYDYLTHIKSKDRYLAKVIPPWEELALK